ncbi:hypothetical protein B0H19DRAFT_957568, partial [Mycena capillaripes]
QVYLLAHVLTVTRPLQQLTVFEHMYLDVGKTAMVVMLPEVDRYLPIVSAV